MISKYFFSNIIIRNFSKKRPEQHIFRNYLINNRKNICIICDKKLPLRTVYFIAIQLLYILMAIHEKGYLFRDLVIFKIHSKYNALLV